MTAKELLYNLISDKIIDFGLKGDKEQFQKFIDQLCKEQREECEKQAYLVRMMDYKSIKYRIINAKQPEV